VEIKVRYLDKVKFEAEARGHRVICDQPPDNDGDDTGMTPSEFLLASLGTCAGFYAAHYLRTRSLPTEGLNVRVTAEKATKPARLGSFRIEVKAPGARPEHREALLRSVKLCLVHNTLTHPPTIETIIETGS
jgi:putative redox protein